jgi:Zn-dependent M28 family amino/carboxypeptidase
LFENYFADADENSTATAFDGRSDYGPFLDVGIPAGGLFTGAEELKTEEETEMFGGEAGVALDACYHSACDNVTNLNMEAFELHAKAIAEAVAIYAVSWEGFPARNATGLTRRVMLRPHVRKASEPRHYKNRRSLAHTMRW